jgi:hypothetical protein
MIKHIFIPFSFAVMACASLHAGELSVKIKLGIRESKLAAITNVPYALAFQIENTGKAVIKQDQIPVLFFKGVIHALRKDGKEQQTEVQKAWRTRVYDLEPGATFESPVVANILTFFPSAKDGDYGVWWTSEDFKSNILHFTVSSGKVIKKE